MIKVGYEQLKITPPVSRSAAKTQSLLFILPMLVTTGVSVLIFSMVTGLSVKEQNTYSLIILGSVILSLLGMAPMQMVMYRLVDEPEFNDGGITRGLRAGILYGLIYSIAISVLALVGFFLKDFFLFSDILFFTSLVLIYSLTWAITSAFFATEQYIYPALVFVLAYLIIYILSLISFQLFPRYFWIAFITGSALLPILSGIIALIVFKKPEGRHSVLSDVRNITKLIASNLMSVVFNVLYVVVIFLDKLIVWLSGGLIGDVNPVIGSPYTAGSFLGMIPMLGVCGVAYFTARTRDLVKFRYDGTLAEIQKRVSEYKKIYIKSLLLSMFSAILFTLAAGLAGYLLLPWEVFRIIVTIGTGCVFLVTILLNASVLPLFGKTEVSTMAVASILIFELASIPFVFENSWFAAAGFLAGNAVGFIMSLCYTAKLLRDFEYNLFRFLIMQVNK